MRNKITLSVLATFFLLSLHAQDCQTLLERFRLDNRSLSGSVNDLTLSNSKLVAQLKVRQDSLIILTKKISTLEREVANLKIQLTNFSNELTKKNIEIGRLKERERKLQEDLKQKTILTDQEKAALLTDLRKTRDDLILVNNDLETGKKQNDSLLQSLKEKDNNLALNDKVLENYASKSRDFIHTKEQDIRFEDKNFKYKDVLFVLKFNKGDREYSPTKEEKEEIERLVELVSRYDNKVKIQMVIGSIEDDQNFRNARAASIKRAFYSFPEPFNLNDDNFSSRLKTTTENYDAAILIVKR